MFLLIIQWYLERILAETNFHLTTILTLHLQFLVQNSTPYYNNDFNSARDFSSQLNRFKIKQNKKKRMMESSLIQFKTIKTEDHSIEENSQLSCLNQEQGLRKFLTLPLRLKVSSYKPYAKHLFSKSLYKQDYTEYKSERVEPIKQQQNMYILNTLELDAESVYKRSFRSRTFEEKTELIRPFYVNVTNTLPMRGAKSIYQCNFTQKDAQAQANKIIKPQSKRMIYDVWGKNMKTQYQRFHTGQKGELTKKITPKQNQLFIMNYQKIPESQYKYDYQSRTQGNTSRIS